MELCGGGLQSPAMTEGGDTEVVRRISDLFSQSWTSIIDTIIDWHGMIIGTTTLPSLK